MRNIKAILTLVLMVGLSTGCSMRHDLSKNYNQYLVANAGKVTFADAKKASSYHLTPQTQSHHYEFRAISTGYANLWMVDFGKMLDATLQSPDVVKALGAMKKSESTEDQVGRVLVFDLKNYTFENFSANISVDISLQSNGKEVFKKSYEQQGESQAGKMLIGGAFGQKSAVHASTKNALDEIIQRLTSDLNKDIQ